MRKKFYSIDVANMVYSDHLLAVANECCCRKEVGERIRKITYEHDSDEIEMFKKSHPEVNGERVLIFFEGEGREEYVPWIRRVSVS
jgi:hypothetical protein